MASAKPAPRRNVLLRRARREAEHRRSERTFWGIFLFGWLGALFAWVTNSADRAQERRFDEVWRRRALEEPHGEAGDPEETPTIAPRARDRAEREALRREARRRRLLRTTLVVVPILLLYLLYMWARFEMRR